MTRRIKTLEFVAPFVSEDPWQAWVEGSDPDTDPVGVGATEQEAIDDLLAKLGDSR